MLLVVLIHLATASSTRKQHTQPISAATKREARTTQHEQSESSKERRAQASRRASAIQGNAKQRKAVYSSTHAESRHLFASAKLFSSKLQTARTGKPMVDTAMQQCSGGMIASSKQTTRNERHKTDSLCRLDVATAGLVPALVDRKQRASKLPPRREPNISERGNENKRSERKKEQSV